MLLNPRFTPRQEKQSTKKNLLGGFPHGVAGARQCALALYARSLPSLPLPPRAAMSVGSIPRRSARCRKFAGPPGIARDNGRLEPRSRLRTNLSLLYSGACARPLKALKADDSRQVGARTAAASPRWRREREPPWSTERERGGEGGDVWL